MIRWQRVKMADGTPRYLAIRNGAPVGEAVMTGRRGVDNYPWDWSLSDVPVVIHPAERRRYSGVADTLRSAKAYVEAALS